MPALCFPNRHFIRRLEKRINLDPGSLLFQCARDAAIAADIDLFLTFVLQTSLGAVESHHVALPGHEGIERVTQVGAVLVAHARHHRILDVHVFAENAAVTIIAVEMLVLQIHRAQPLDGLHIQDHSAFARFRTTMTALAPVLQAEAIGYGGSIELAFAHGKNRFRQCAQPPIDQIEMVGGLVHRQATGVFLPAMPAAKVIDAVVGIQHPMKVYREHVADDSAHQQVFDLRSRRRITIVESHRAFSTGAFLRIENALTFVLVNSHWLFGDDITTRLHGAT